MKLDSEEEAKGSPVGQGIALILWALILSEDWQWQMAGSECLAGWESVRVRLVGVGLGVQEF